MEKEVVRDAASARQIAQVNATADAKLRDLDEGIESYRANPFFPHERALFAALEPAHAPS